MWYEFLSFQLFNFRIMRVVPKILSGRCVYLLNSPSFLIHPEILDCFLEGETELNDMLISVSKIDECLQNE